MSVVIGSISQLSVLFLTGLWIFFQSSLSAFVPMLLIITPVTINIIRPSLAMGWPVPKGYGQDFGVLRSGLVCDGIVPSDMT
jgi:hypothetical protein